MIASKRNNMGVRTPSDKHGSVLGPRLRGAPSPTAYSGLEAWYDVSDASSLVVDSSNRVSLMADKSGNSGVNGLVLNAVSGNYARSTNRIAGNSNSLTVRARLSMVDWAGGSRIVVNQDNGTTQRTFEFGISAGGFLYLDSGGNTATSTSALPFAAYQTGCIQMQLDGDNTSVSFGYSTQTDIPASNATYTALGSGVNEVWLTGVSASTQDVTYGANAAGTGGLWAGQLFDVYMEADDGGGGDWFHETRFYSQAKLATSFAGVDGGTVTVTSTGDLGARICGSRDAAQLTLAKQPIYLPWSGTNYGWLRGNSADFYFTPDSAAFPTSDIDIQWFGRLADYTPSGTDVSLVVKFGSAGQRSFRFLNLTDGRLYFGWSADGTTELTAISTNPGITDNTDIGFRVTMDADNGAGGKTVLFYTSTNNGATWTLLTTATTAGTTSIFDSNVSATIAVSTTLTQVYRATISSTIGGAPVVDFDPSRYTSGTTFTASTGEVWTINGKAVIVTRSCLYADGVDDYMRTRDFGLSQAFSRYFIGTQVTWVSTRRITDGLTDGAAAIVQSGSTPNVNMNAGVSSTAISTFILRTRSILGTVFNGAASLIRSGRNPATTVNAGTQNSLALSIGAGGAGGLPANITFSEGMTFTGADDNAKMDRLALYAAKKWSIDQ